MGFGTPVVYTLKNEYFNLFDCKLMQKYSAWIVWSQDRNLTDLAGICSNGGTCGLMR